MSRVAKEVTGVDNTSIYMGESYNDVPISDLDSNSQKVSFLGDISIDDNDETYMDLYDGWVEKSELSKTVRMLRLK